MHKLSTTPVTSVHTLLHVDSARRRTQEYRSHLSPFESKHSITLRLKEEVNNLRGTLSVAQQQQHAAQLMRLGRDAKETAKAEQRWWKGKLSGAAHAIVRLVIITGRCEERCVQLAKELQVLVLKLDNMLRKLRFFFIYIYIYMCV